MPLVANRYEILRPLGSGGMAEVVAAHDTRLGRDVAIKVIRSEQLGEPISRARLLREARAAAALHHPNSVAVYDVGEDDDPYIVMELVEGETLAARLRQRGPLPVEASVRIGTALLDALEAAHARGLVHRDIKPSNVLLSADGAVKLADFGIAKALDSTDPGLTMTGQVLGTPRYLSPEQAAGEPATPASDLYSLGAVLYECVAGRPPFDGTSALGIALAHQRIPVPPLLEVAPQAPVALAATIERALRKEPHQRFVDAAEMRSHLRAAVAASGASPGAATVPLAGAQGRAAPHLPSDGDADASTRSLDDAGPSQGGWIADADDPADVHGRSRRAGWWLAATLGVVAVLAVAVLPQLGGTAEEPPDGTGGAAQQPAGEGAEPDAAGGDPDGEDPDGQTTQEREPEPEPAPEPAPDTAADALDELIADLARDPDAAGRHGDRLLRALMELREEQDEGDRAEDARDLITEIAAWRSHDHLDAAAAEAAVDVLEVIGRPSDPGLADASALFAEIALSTDEWGRKAKDLLEDLDALLGEDPEDHPEDAASISEEIDAWIDEGELDEQRGRRAQEVLSPLSARS